MESKVSSKIFGTLRNTYSETPSETSWMKSSKIFSFPRYIADPFKPLNLVRYIAHPVGTSGETFSFARCITDPFKISGTMISIDQLSNKLTKS